MSDIVYKSHTRISLKEHSVFNEKWLQTRITEDPVMLGLGNVLVLERERRQDRAGRLDLLLSSIEGNKRFEVELMLGATDESHVIRAIEYYDIERRRYPGYDHCAVLIAEDVTSRFLNVLSLFSGAIPFIAIQLNAIQVDHVLVLDFVRVLDQRLLRKDDTTEIKQQPASRDDWRGKSSEDILKIMDTIIDTINSTSKVVQKPNYNRQYVGLTDGIRVKNFMYFRPRKKFLQIVIPDGWTAERQERLEQAEIESQENDGDLVFNLSTTNMQKNSDVVSDVVREIVEEKMQ